MKYSIELSTDQYIGLKIKECRIGSGLTQGQLAKELGISEMGLSFIEHGQRPIKVNLFRKLQGILLKQAEYFLPPNETSEIVIPRNTRKRKNL